EARHDAGHQCGILAMQSETAKAAAACILEPGLDPRKQCLRHVDRELQPVIEFPEVGVADQIVEIDLRIEGTEFQTVAKQQAAQKRLGIEPELEQGPEPAR